MGKIDPIARVVTIVGGSWRLWAAAMMCLAEQGLYLGKCSIVMPNAFLGVAEFWSWATPRFGPRLLDSDKLRDKPEFACHDFGCNELRMLASVEILRQGRLGTKRSLTFRPEFTFFPNFFPYMYVYSHTHIYIYTYVCMYYIYTVYIHTCTCATYHLFHLPSYSKEYVCFTLCLARGAWWTWAALAFRQKRACDAHCWDRLMVWCLEILSFQGHVFLVTSNLCASPHVSVRTMESLHKEKAERGATCRFL